MKTSFNLSNIWKVSIFLIFKIKILFRQCWTTLYYKLKQYPQPFSPLSSTKEPSTFGWTMNYEYTSLYRPRLFSFDLNFYSQFILSWKNGSNESMNYDRGWARFVRIFMRYRVPWRLRISIYPWRQCFLLRMHTNNFHPLSLWLCNHFKL